ncbi:MAG: hypothetical protein HW416_3611, partial [Chloroflexi bacterium]|nr:hypothetical protein [Chloroflexota bacterium]
AWAVLAGFGLQTLMDRRGSPKWGAPATVGLAATLGLTALAASAGIEALRGALEANPAASIAWIQSSYLSLRHHAEGLEAIDVYRGLMYSLDYANPRTIFSLVALGVSAVIVAGIGLSGRGRTIWALAAFLGTAFDLISFSGSLHQKASVQSLVQPTPAVQFLSNCVTGGAQCGMTGGEWRIYTPGTIASLEFDRLVPFRIQEIGGYSSLESRRSFTYWSQLNNTQNQLADLANVRYLVYPAQPPALPSYSHVPFDPDRPLAVASRASLGDGDSYSFGGAVAHRLQIVAALTHSIDVPHGEVVAEVRVMGQDGTTAAIPLRAGRDVAEWAYDRPDVVSRVKHERAETIAFRRPDVFPIDGSRYDRYLFYSERDLPAAMQVDRVSVHYVHPEGEIEVYGIGLFNFETGATAGATPTMRSKLSLVYRDRDLQIMENRDAFPRAYVVPNAILSNTGESPISRMLDRPFDPTRQVLLEAAPGLNTPSGGQRAVQEAASLPVAIDSESQSATDTRQTPVAAVPLSIEPDRVVYRASAPTGGYLVHAATFFPGWRARVDGADAQILPANALFRAVPLPAGEHLVELRYEPPSVELGLNISVWASAMGGTTVLAAVLATLVQRVLATFRGRSPRRARPRRPASV